MRLPARAWRAICRRGFSARGALAVALLSAGSGVPAALTPPYAALVARVTSGPEEDLRTFARVAFEQMAASYEAEAAKGGGAGGRWRNYMQQEAAVLRSRAARIGEARRITLAQDGPDGVRLIIDGENVIVTSPRLDSPERLEAAIVGEACLYIPCDAPRPGDGGAVAVGDVPGSPREASGPAGTPADAPAERTWPRLAVQGAELPAGRWFRLANGGATFRTANGLNFQFREPGGRQESLATLCERVGADLERLAAALAHAREQHWPLVWEYLRLGPVLGGEQSVVINPLGDAFLLPMQEAAIVGHLLPASIAWLQRRAAGDGSQQYFPEADRLLVLTSPGPTYGVPAAPPQAAGGATAAAPLPAGPGMPSEQPPVGAGLSVAPPPGIGAGSPALAPARDGEGVDASARPLPAGWRPL